VSTTLAINHCHGFQVFAGDVDTSDQFISPGPLIRVCEVSMDALFHDGFNDTMGGWVRLRGPEISPFWLEVVLAGASDQGV
jgi:hypothetical protein